jgi:DNA-binding GntR family transcriptional regulator
MQPLDPQPALIDRAYEQLAEAIADGTLAPGRRIRQEELGRALGVSWQPISHALQLLKRQKLVEENGRRGLIVSEIDPDRVRDLYQVRSALDALAGNRAIVDTVAAQWPRLKRSMGAVLDDPEQRPLVWTEHREILRCFLAGDPAGAERAARAHADRAGSETSRRLSQSSSSR